MIQELAKTLDSKSLQACFAKLQSGGKPLALATVVQAISPTSGRPGDKALVNAEAIIEGWIGGGCAQPAVIEAAGLALESGDSTLIRVGPKGEWQAMQGVVDFTSGCLSGGTLLIFVEPMIRQPVLTILGNSPAAHHLCRLADELDFSIRFACPDPGDANLPGNVTQLTDFSDVDGDYIVIATQGNNDRAALKAALGTGARHIAMIASAKKIAALKAGLGKAGAQATQLERIHSPAGIEIGAQTPAEIALSVLAELVRVRRNAVASQSSAAQPAATMTAAPSGGCCND